MRSALKWTLPAVAAIALLTGWSLTSVAQNAEAKGKITGTVKTADGQPAANLSLDLRKGDVEFPARGGRGGNRGAGGGGGAPAPQAAAAPTPGPATLPAPVASTTTDAQGVYTFADLEPGDYTVMTQVGRGGRAGGGAGGPGAPGAAAPGGGGRGMGRGRAHGVVKAGETLKLDFELQAGRGGRGGAGGAGGPGGGGGGGRRGGGGAGGAGAPQG